MKQKVCEYLASVIVNNNEVRLVKKNGRYFIHWGEANKIKDEQELTTPKGRRPSLNQVHKKFLEACKAAEYIKFSKL